MLRRFTQRARGIFRVCAAVPVRDSARARARSARRAVPAARTRTAPAHRTARRLDWSSGAPRRTPHARRSHCRSETDARLVDPRAFAGAVRRTHHSPARRGHKRRQIKAWHDFVRHLYLYAGRHAEGKRKCGLGHKIGIEITSERRTRSCSQTMSCAVLRNHLADAPSRAACAKPRAAAVMAVRPRPPALPAMSCASLVASCQLASLLASPSARQSCSADRYRISGSRPASRRRTISRVRRTRQGSIAATLSGGGGSGAASLRRRSRTALIAA